MALKKVFSKTRHSLDEFCSIHGGTGVNFYHFSNQSEKEMNSFDLSFVLVFEKKEIAYVFLLKNSLAFSEGPSPIRNPTNTPGRLSV